MNIQMNLLPSKHLLFAESLVGLAGFLRKLLKQPRTIDELWTLLDNDKSGWPVKPSFTNLVLAVDILYALKQIEHITEDRIQAIPNETD